LAYTCLDRVPAGQSRCEVHVAGQSKIVRVEDLVRGWIVELNYFVNRVRKHKNVFDLRLLWRGCQPYG
jgi:hypothetical protein